VQAHAHVVGGKSQLRRNTLTRRLFKIDAADYLSVFRLEVRQNIANKTARERLVLWPRGDFAAGFARKSSLPVQACGTAAIVVSQRVPQDPAEPGIDFLAVLQGVRGAERLEAEILQRILGVLGPGETTAEEAEEFLSAFDELTVDCGIPISWDGHVWLMV
jgi:hypothetical protein